jgi:predicted nucleic-acid-binding Zn-ribbon protein
MRDSYESFWLNKWTYSMEHKLCSKKFNSVHISCNSSNQLHIQLWIKIYYFMIFLTQTSFHRPSSGIIKLQRHTFMIKCCQRCAYTKSIYSTMWYSIAEKSVRYIIIMDDLQIFTNLYWRLGSIVSIATAYGLDGPGIESQWGRGFPHLSRPALRPTQPPVKWVPGLSRG